MDILKSWRLNQAIEIVDAAVCAALDAFSTSLDKGNTPLSNFQYTPERTPSARIVYKLEYWGDVPSFSDERAYFFKQYKGSLGQITLRKLGDNSTKLNIPDYSLQEAMGDLSVDSVDRITAIRDSVINTLLQDLSSDGLLAQEDLTKLPASKKLEIDFVDASRIEELRKINTLEFDLTKLIQLCKELNTCFSQESYLATAMLIRAILDHVPPIFKKSNFKEVANKYNASGLSNGSRSFKGSMQNLENSSRKIADAHLHIHIRSKESLPNRTQVDFHNDLDVLLQEIVRILK